MPKVARYLVDFNAVNGAGQSAPLYAKDQCYPVSDETTRHVALGYAVLVDAPDQVEETNGATDASQASSTDASATTASTTDKALTATGETATADVAATTSTAKKK